MPCIIHNFTSTPKTLGLLKQCLFVVYLGGEYSEDVCEFSLKKKLIGFDILNGSASAQAKNHAIFNILNDLVSVDLVEVIFVLYFI